MWAALEAAYFPLSGPDRTQVMKLTRKEILPTLSRRGRSCLHSHCTYVALRCTRICDERPALESARNRNRPEHLLGMCRAVRLVPHHRGRQGDQDCAEPGASRLARCILREGYSRAARVDLSGV